MESSGEIAAQYERLAKDWAEAFQGEHDNKPKDQEMLVRFADEVREHSPVWDLGCGPGNTTKYLHDLGINISGLDLSNEMAKVAERLHPGLHFRKGDMLSLAFEDESIAGIVRSTPSFISQRIRSGLHFVNSSVYYSTVVFCC